MKIKKYIIKKYLFSYLALFSNKFDFKKKEKEYYKTYNEPYDGRIIIQGIVIMFDGKQIHCGITDRLKGICSIFEYARINDLSFHIYFRSPFKLEDYLMPNNYDWRLRDEQITYNKNKAVPVFLNDWQSLTKLHIKYLDKIVKANPDKQIHVYGNSPYYIDQYGKNFKFLFRWSDNIDLMIKQCMLDIGSNNYISVALRFQQLLGDFREEHAIFKVLNNVEQEKLMRKCRDKIMQIIKEKQIKTKILITCDSVKFLDYISRIEQIYIVPGSIAHIDNSHVSDKSIYNKLFLDMAMLSHSQCIYQLITDDMYANSGFAQQAAVIGNGKYEQIYF